MPNHWRTNILVNDSLARDLPARGRRISCGDQNFGVAPMVGLQSKRKPMLAVNAKILVW
jgi:hypothetical protein